MSRLDGKAVVVTGAASGIGKASMQRILLDGGGVAGVDKVLFDTARTFRLSTRDILWKIVLPAASPSIVAGMRISLAVALILTVIAEMVASNNGIGFFILDTERAFRITDMYAGIFTLMVVGYVLNRLFVLFEARALAWYFGQSRQERG